MILDTSAIVSILFCEPGYEALVRKLTDAPNTNVGVPALVEAGIVVSARLKGDARGLLARFLQESSITTIPLTETHVSVAVEAWLRFGKGRHPASLNFGDCLSYAIAKVAGQPLLCVGNDFSRTDLALA